MEMDRGHAGTVTILSLFAATILFMTAPQKSKLDTSAYKMSSDFTTKDCGLWVGPPRSVSILGVFRVKKKINIIG